MIGCVVSVGKNTKIEYSTRNRPEKKQSKTLQSLNHCNLYLIAFLFFICTVYDYDCVLCVGEFYFLCDLG